MAENFEQFNLEPVSEPDSIFNEAGSAGNLLQKDVQSQNYSHRQRGWRLRPNGTVEMRVVHIGSDDTDIILGKNGYYSFGAEADGSAILDGTNTVTWASKSGSTYTMTRDAYLKNLTISSGVTLKPAGYRPFGTGLLSNSGTIQRNGNAGGNGDASAGGAGGAALAAGYILGSAAGKDGGFASGAGTVGASVTNSLGSNGGGSGGNGGSNGGGTGGNGAAGGTATATKYTLADNWILTTYLDFFTPGFLNTYNNSAGSGSGGGGEHGGAADRGGGGSGSAGGILVIPFANIQNNSDGTISSVGGAGGNGGDGDGNIPPGGGGGGGNGGEIILVYNNYVNRGTVTVAAGAAGSRGGNTAFGAGNGTAGTVGNIRTFQLEA